MMEIQHRIDPTSTRLALTHPAEADATRREPPTSEIEFWIDDFVEPRTTGE